MHLSSWLTGCGAPVFWHPAKIQLSAKYPSAQKQIPPKTPPHDGTPTASVQFSDSHATKLQSHHLFTPLPIRSLLDYKGYQAAHNYMVRLSRPQRLSYDERVVIDKKLVRKLNDTLIVAEVQFPILLSRVDLTDEAPRQFTNFEIEEPDHVRGVGWWSRLEFHQFIKRGKRLAKLLARWEYCIISWNYGYVDLEELRLGKREELKQSACFVLLKSLATVGIILRVVEVLV
ncbi:hypothetical protein L207DRAFT_538316 [Hyaloscypha variabilis F]|uniref:Uncharacterized protein n=1 Tax=Hyaloscypha variabilis (strain UAMH 11265 / GT02V1 / F) TaxID=1149755 RepID=A0A2J6QV54_HYAVF|nr:hypothetical protein L207DRAFT_538316 [Hyaloscypha variabilis F]